MVCLRLSLYPVFSPCKTNPCLYDGTCVAKEKGFKCLCHKNLYDLKCEGKYQLLLVDLTCSLGFIIIPKGYPIYFIC